MKRVVTSKPTTSGAATETSTVYIGGFYEKQTTGSVTKTTKYYSAFGRVIAMRASLAAGSPESGANCDNAIDDDSDGLINDGCVQYLLSDHLDTTTGLLGSGGTLIGSQKYWPYGATRSGGITQTDKLYTGQQRETGDSALGLYNYKARFVGSSIGRFLSADPVSIDGWNRLAYARNSPVVHDDPSGLCVGRMHCDSSVALNIAACAASIDGCARVSDAQDLRNAAGRRLNGQELAAAHAFAKAAASTGEFWSNFFLPDINPYFNGRALENRYGANPLVPSDFALPGIFAYANLTFGKMVPSVIAHTLNAVADAVLDYAAGAAVHCANDILNCIERVEIGLTGLALVAFAPAVLSVGCVTILLCAVSIPAAGAGLFAGATLIYVAVTPWEHEEESH